MGLFSNYRAIGMENIPDPPVLITTNHLSYWDLFAVGAVVQYTVPVFAAKKYQRKWWGWLFNIGAPVWVEQGSSDRNALKLAIRLIKQGHPFGIAPEGTRSQTGALGKGRDGAAFIVRHTHVPVLPVAFWGTENIFKQPRPEVRVVIGKPYHLPEDRQLKDHTERIMCAIAALLPEQYRGYYAGNPLIEEMEQTVA